MSRLRRKKKRGDSRIRRFLGWFRRGTQGTATQRNRVKLFPNGGDFFPALFEAVAEAQRSICLEFYIIRDDVIGRELALHLENAVQRGVKVSLLYDYIGCFDTPSAYFRRLEQAGAACRSFNPPPFRRGLAWFDKRNHRKIAVVDGSTAFAGGLNIGVEYAGYGENHEQWRDVGVRMHGPAALELQRLFNESWQGETGSPPAACSELSHRLKGNGDATVHIVSGGPHHNRSYIRNAFRLAIAGAVRRIVIATPYFIPGPRIIRSLLRAVRKGVQVQLLLPAVSDVPLVRLVSRGTYAQLLKGGIEIYEREGTILHAKVMHIDGGWTVLGSANIDQRSFHRNYEVNVIVGSRTFGRQVDRMLADDLGRSRPITLDAHEQRGWIIRLLERLVSPISWFL
jgi:cardiolipin synthase